MRTMVIFNPYSAKGRAVKSFSRINELLASYHVEYARVFTERRMHAEELTRKAIGDGYERIVSVGGDGTLNEVVNGMMKENKPVVLGIIPTGTCNDFIKAAGIPADVESACRIIRSGVARKFDVAKVNDRFCVNVCGVGFDVEVARQVNQSKFIAGFLHHMAVILKNIFTYKGLKLILELDGKREEHRVLLFSVANGICYGGDFPISPQSDASDGLLNAVLIKDIRALARLKVLNHVIKGTHLELDNVTMTPVKKVKISSDFPLLVQIEGELIQSQTNIIDINVIHNGLRILVPKDGDF
ncbi:diacylglycerol kinase family lipid kinase [candidate division KSB1 bacterium]|nr:diacylglycerol kinase family lipid kinase [candidate division KSB1 bacterium]